MYNNQLFTSVLFVLYVTNQFNYLFFSLCLRVSAFTLGLCLTKCLDGFKKMLSSKYVINT